MDANFAVALMNYNERKYALIKRVRVVMAVFGISLFFLFLGKLIMSDMDTASIVEITVGMTLSLYIPVRIVSSVIYSLSGRIIAAFALVIVVGAIFEKYASGDILGYTLLALDLLDLGIAGIRFLIARNNVRSAENSYYED